MSVLCIVAGVVLVLAILWEVFHDLFDPAGTGALSDWIGRAVFGAMRRRRSLLPAAGPVTLTIVILTWMVGLIVGFALIYSAGYPTQFRTSTDTIPVTQHGWIDVTYVSFETLVTLGYGDVVPKLAVLRFVATVEALLGFGLLTASLSSIILIYPALARLRTLALGVAHLAGGETSTGVSPAMTDSDVVLIGLAQDVTRTRIDFVHFPVIYFFGSDNEASSLATWTGVLQRYAREGADPQRPPHVRVAGAALDRSLGGLADILSGRFATVSGDNRDEIFRAYAEAHLVERR